MRFALVLLAAALAMPAFAAFADDDEGPIAVSEKDYATWSKLRDAKAVASEREFRSGRKPDKLEKAKAGLEKSFKESGWTQERFEQVGSALSDAAMAVNEATENPGPDANANLDNYNKVTVATARAHRKEIMNGDERQRAEQQVAAEAKSESAGTPVTKAGLQGTWVMDLSASVDLMGGGVLQGADKEKVMKQIRDQQGEVSYTFSGDTVESKSSRGVEKGTYRVDGAQIFFKTGKRERPLEAGMLSNGTLAMGLGFGKMVFRKK